MSLLYKDVKPELYTPESLKRKEEMLEELFSCCMKLRMHLMACGFERTMDEEFKCEICEKKIPCLINYMLENEKKLKGKTNFPKMVKDGVIDEILFSEGVITFNNANKN